MARICGITEENLDCRLRIVESTISEVGDLIEGTRAAGNASSLTTATSLTIASVVLTEGTWEVSGIVNLGLAAATTTNKRGSISSTTNVDGVDKNKWQNSIPTTTLSGTVAQAIPAQQVVVASGATATRYLIAYAEFSAGTIGAYGNIRAVRIK